MSGNFSLLTNITDIVSLTQAVHIASGYWLGNLMVLISFLVMFAVLKRFENNYAFAVSSFVTAIIAILLKQLLIVNDQVLILAIFIAVIAALFTFMKDD